MPSLELSHAYDPFVYWPRAGTKESGDPIVGDPVQMYGRWDTKKREVQSPTRGPISIDGTIYQLTQDLVIGSAVWYGLTSDLPGSASSPQDIMYVVMMDGVKDIKNRGEARNALLVRSMDKIS